MIFLISDRTIQNKNPSFLSCSSGRSCVSSTALAFLACPFLQPIPWPHVKKGTVADSKAIHPADVSFWELGDQPLVNFEEKDCGALGQSRSHPHMCWNGHGAKMVRNRKKQVEKRTMQTHKNKKIHEQRLTEQERIHISFCNLVNYRLDRARELLLSVASTMLIVCLILTSYSRKGS